MKNIHVHSVHYVHVSKLNRMEEFLTKDIEALQEQKEERARTVVGRQLASFVDMVPDKSEFIDAIIEGAKSRKAAWPALCELLSPLVVEAADGNITAVEYSQRAMSKQSLHVFVGTHWKPIRTQIFYDFVNDCCERAGLTDTYLQDPDFMNKVYERVGFMVARDRQMYVPHGEVWVNMQNGTLVVNSRGDVQLRVHDREDFFTYVLPYHYLPMADCPKWHKFLDQVLPEEQAQMLLAEYMGYCFTTDLKMEKMLVLYGGGSNGKSVTTDILRELLGRENVSSVDLEKLTTDDNHRSLIEGKLANIAQENGQNVAYSILKNIVSGEPVMVKTLYKDPKLITQYGKLISSYNQLPRSEATLGFFRRWIVMPFDVTIKEEERDVHLKDKLCEELPGILNWVLEGLKRLVMNHAFTESEACNDALTNYKLTTNSVLRFCEERLVVSENGSMTIKTLYDEYKKYCYEDGVEKRYGRNNFIEQIEKWGATYVMTGNQKNFKVMFKSEL